MSEHSKARLDVIDEMLGSDESVRIDVRGLLFDPGDGLKKREAEGHLVLTDCRLIFGTPQRGIMIVLGRKDIRTPVSVTMRWLMARLRIETCGGDEHTFVVNKTAARGIAFDVNNVTRA